MESDPFMGREKEGNREEQRCAGAAYAASTSIANEMQERR
jgi:hypothetical protein